MDAAVFNSQRAWRRWCLLYYMVGWLFTDWWSVLIFSHPLTWDLFLPEGSRLSYHTDLRPVSRLPLKSAPLLVRAAFGGRCHRRSSHRRSIFHVSICFVLFPVHLVFIPQSIYMYLFRCSPTCLCVRLFMFVCIVDAPDWLVFPCYFHKDVYC